MNKKAGKAARYSRLLKTIFNTIEKSGNLDSIRWGNSSDLIVQDGHKILELQKRYEKIKKGK